MGVVENTYAELKQQELKNNPYSCLHMADIDINPHQVEAFTFALSSLELGGAILADEVGLGKTIEAGLVIKYLLCSGKNKILLIMPSNLRKQWQVELEEKFDIDSLIVDSSNWEDCIIVTQRTANVTKSILNQCNTIFALRVFDDTGKSFLENYIGRDYSDTLPTLEERHAIVIGKGIGLKQPVILQLNDMKYLQTNDGEKIVEKNECVDVETEEIPPNL